MKRSALRTLLEEAPSVTQRRKIWRAFALGIADVRRKRRAAQWGGRFSCNYARPLRNAYYAGVAAAKRTALSPSSDATTGAPRE